MDQHKHKMGFQGGVGGGLTFQFNQKLKFKQIPYSAGTGWQQVKGPLGFTWISCGAVGEVLGISLKHELYKRVGITRANPIGNKWTLINGLFLQVSVFHNQVWAVTIEGLIYHRIIKTRIQHTQTIQKPRPNLQPHFKPKTGKLKVRDSIT